MIRLHDMRHGPFEAIEELNPRAVAGRLRICITVDTESCPCLPEASLVARLLAGFPGLSRHGCRARTASAPSPTAGTRILLVEGEPSANQAHPLEHLVLDLLGVFEPSVLRSGVTRAWQEPPERNDIFIERRDLATGTGTAAISLAMLAFENALEDRPLTPLFGDVVRVWSVFAQAQAAPVSPRHVAHRSGLPRTRVEQALAVLTDNRLLRSEPFAVHISGETHFRTR